MLNAAIDAKRCNPSCGIAEASCNNPANWVPHITLPWGTSHAAGRKDGNGDRRGQRHRPGLREDAMADQGAKVVIADIDIDDGQRRSQPRLMAQLLSNSTSQIATAGSDADYRS
jgi:hypothetical protein